MKENLRESVYSIPVPPTLRGQILAACETAATCAPQRPLRRIIPIAVAAAACVAVAAVAVALPTRPPISPNPLPDGGISSTTTTADTTDESTTTTTADTTDESTTTTTADTTVTTTTTTTTTAATEATDSVGPTKQTVTSTKPTKITTTTRPTKTPTGDIVVVPSTSLSYPTSTTTSTTVAVPTTVDPRPSMPAGSYHYMLSTVGEYIGMTVSELETYYGHKLIPPSLPSDLKQNTSWAEYGYYLKSEAGIATEPGIWEWVLEEGIARDDKVIYDYNSVQWFGGENADGFERMLIVKLSKNPYPQDQARWFPTSFNATWTVNDNTVSIYTYIAEDGWTTRNALVVLEDVTYYIQTSNMETEELRQILESLL